MIGNSGEVLGVCFGPKGTAFSGGLDPEARRWDLNTGKSTGVFPNHYRGVICIASSDPANLLATSSGDVIWLWDLDTGKKLRQFTASKDNLVFSISFSPDGKQLLTSNFDNILRVWNVGNGKESKRITDSRGVCATFSPDGKRIASGGCDSSVSLWDAATGEELRTYEGHAHSVESVAFFPDGRRIVSASSDGTARIWRVPR